MEEEEEEEEAAATADEVESLDRDFGSSFRGSRTFHESTSRQRSQKKFCQIYNERKKKKKRKENQSINQKKILFRKAFFFYILVPYRLLDLLE